MNPAMKVKNIKYTNANISFGYATTGSLPATVWHACLSPLPLPTKLPMWTQKQMKQKHGTVNSIWIFWFGQGLSTTQASIT